MPVQQEPVQSFDYKPLQDSIVQKLIQWNSQANMDSILNYADHQNPNLRYQVAKCLASPTNKDHIEIAVKLLFDSVIQVKEMAAFAVGQAADNKWCSTLINSYNDYDSTGDYGLFNANVLEAVGKCGTRAELNLFTSMKPIPNSDEQLLLGQMRGIFQLLLKSIESEAGNKLAFQYLINNEYPNSVRELAGYYLVRNKKTKPKPFINELKSLVLQNDNHMLKVYGIHLLGKNTSNATFKFWKGQFEKENRPNIKISILKVLSKYPYSTAKNTMRKLTENADEQIASLASAFFISKGQPDDAAQYWDDIKSKNLRTISKLNMAVATVKNLPFYYTLTRNEALAKIISTIGSIDNEYEKALAIKSLKHLPEQLNVLSEHYNSKSSPIIKSTIAATVFDMSKNYDNLRTLNQKGRFNSGAIKLINKLIEDGDVGALAVIANRLTDKDGHIRKRFRNAKGIKLKLNTLEIPQEIETYNAIAELLISLGDQSVQLKKSTNFKTFNLTLYKKLSDSTFAIVESNKGIIRINLLPNESPIGVTNFVELVQSDYFNGKNIHRVVPNFVVQTGCPRGDGYGSLDFTFRSEFGEKRYDKPGVIGMASIGPDTECSQWFGTHLPAFHLDGRYTIIGEAAGGNQFIEQTRVGDKIKKISVYNLKK